MSKPGALRSSVQVWGLYMSSGPSTTGQLVQAPIPSLPRGRRSSGRGLRTVTGDSMALSRYACAVL